MGQPMYRAAPPPPRAGADLAISISALVLTVVIGAGSAVTGLFSLAFLDHCPPESCSAEGAATAVLTSLGVALAIGVVGLVVAVVQLVRRRTAWPFAVATLGLCIVALACGGVGYAVAVGA